MDKLIPCNNRCHIAHNVSLPSGSGIRRQPLLVYSCKSIIAYPSYFVNTSNGGGSPLTGVLPMPLRGKGRTNNKHSFAPLWRKPLGGIADTEGRTTKNRYCISGDPPPAAPRFPFSDHMEMWFKPETEPFQGVRFPDFTLLIGR